MMDWMEGNLRGFFTITTSSRRLSDTTTEAVPLIPFDVTLALSGETAVDTFALTDAVEQWLYDSFVESSASLNFRFNFKTVGLRTITPGANVRHRTLQATLKVTFDGMTYWGKNTEIPSETTVAAMELEALVDSSALLTKLRAQPDSRGLGSAVLDARGDLNRNAKDMNANGGGGGGSLDDVIIVAIVIAILASALLAFALFIAWKGSKEGKEPYDEAVEISRDAEESAMDQTAVNTTAGPYPDSVISEDIQSSLSAYYKSGMAGGYKEGRNKAGGLNDAASVSSMESYGYSLDGYASSIAN